MYSNFVSRMKVKTLLLTCCDYTLSNSKGNYESEKQFEHKFDINYAEVKIIVISFYFAFSL